MTTTPREKLPVAEALAGLLRDGLPLRLTAYDGSAAGVPSTLDLDGIQAMTGPAGFLVSFDTSGSIGALTFDDEDVLRFDSGLGTYAMYFNGSISDPADWPRADLSALPEPSLVSALAAGAALLAGANRWRRR